MACFDQIKSGQAAIKKAALKKGGFLLPHRNDTIYLLCK
jgi:hypothetical protein